MAKIRTQINCPQCGQMIAAEIEQVFDAGADPGAKQRFLSGQYNLASCPHCGFNGNIATPLAYHDPEKELLLTFVPPGLNLPMEEQEKTIGKLINQVVDNIPQEQRKGYIFSPQRVLTMQGLVERILKEEGISKEMIEEQQAMVNLIQRLATISDDEALAHVAKEEDENIDARFFSLLNQLIQGSLARGDNQGAQALTQLQQRLLPITTFGQELQAQSQEMEAAINTLKEVGEGLTREKLLDLVIEAPNNLRVDAYVSLARGGMDYQFFQLLSEKIDAAEGDEKQKLSDLREHILEATAEIDKEIEARMNLAHQNIERLLEVDNIKETTFANLGAIDEFFLQALNDELVKAKEEKNTEREEKLNQIAEALAEATKAAAGPDSELLQALIDADEEGRKKIFEERADDITPQFVEALTGLLVQLDGPDNVEMADKVRTVYREAVRHSMQASMNKEG